MMDFGVCGFYSVSIGLIAKYFICDCSCSISSSTSPHATSRTIFFPAIFGSAVCINWLFDVAPTNSRSSYEQLQFQIRMSVCTWLNSAQPKPVTWRRSSNCCEIWFIAGKLLVQIELKPFKLPMKTTIATTTTKSKESYHFSYKHWPMCV